MPLNYFMWEDNEYKNNPQIQNRLKETECSVLAIPGQEIQLSVIQSPGIRHAWTVKVVISNICSNMQLSYNLYCMNRSADSISGF